MGRPRARCCAFVAIVVALAGPTAERAPAQTLYGVTSTGIGNVLIKIDTTTGVGSLVGPLTAPVGPTDLAFRGRNLYLWDNGANRLREINATTGATVTEIDVGIVTGRDGGLTFRADGIGFLSQTNSPSPNSRLWSFDITVPSSNTITTTLAPNINSLAFNAGGVLYGLTSAGDQLYTINQTTGTTTLVGNTGIAGPFAEGGLVFSPAGELFAALCDSGTNPTFLYRLDPTTGAGTLIGNIGFNQIQGIAFAPGVTLAPSGGSTDVTEGGATDTYTVVLDVPPTSNVTITVNPGTQVMAAPTTLTFTPTNWNVPQTVTVTAVDDALAEGAHTGIITHTATSADSFFSGITIANVAVNITDNDGGPPPPSPGPSGPEGTHVGSSSGTSGSEGSYGFGQRARGATLSGPFVVAPGQQAVFNVSHRAGGEALSATEEDRNVLFTAAFAGLLALAVLLGIRTSRAT